MKKEKLRRMKSYHPRRKRRTASAIEKQQLKDLEHKISKDIGDYIVLVSEGSPDQVEVAKQRTKTDLMKFAPDMKKIAEQMGGHFTTDVEEYLESIYDIINSSTGWVDEAMLSHCFRATKQLEDDLVL